MPNFRPDTGRQRWSLVQVAGSLALRGGAGAASPSTLLRLPAALYGACPVLRAAPALRSSTKARNKKLRLLFASSPSERLRQPGACRAHSPRVRRSFCPPRPQPQSPPAPVGCCALCLAATLPRMSTIQNLRRSLIRNWRPVCSAVGLRSLGPSPPLSPPRCLQSPAGLGRSAACELFSGLARSLCSANGRQCVRAD